MKQFNNLIHIVYRLTGSILQGIYFCKISGFVRRMNNFKPQLLVLYLVSIIWIPKLIQTSIVWIAVHEVKCFSVLHAFNECRIQLFNKFNKFHITLTRMQDHIYIIHIFEKISQNMPSISLDTWHSLTNLPLMRRYNMY